ncbi:SPOR domain-containing protein [Chitinivorax sp. PXF-14]|uniref:SPOR domain-containing protein n=1 Tax=Chitinivorax sp. PXF-14 TaxID=3230488 RepID=UPI0034673B57
MSEPTSAEELLLLKKRARRRLVGAVALVLIAVIVLWNVLDGEPKSASQHVNVQAVEIVSDAPQLKPVEPAKALQARPSALDSHDKSMDSGSQGPAAPAAKPMPATPPVAPLLEPPVSKKEATPAPAKPEASKPEIHKAEPRKMEAAATPKPAVEHAAAAEKEAKPAKTEPKPKPEAKDVPAVKADPKGAVAIQVAALSEEAKARQLASKLSAAGVPAYAEPKGPLTRVRAGPFANRMQAEKALAKLQSLGYSGVVVPK